jgi:hypothetical protein
MRHDEKLPMHGIILMFYRIASRHPSHLTTNNHDRRKFVPEDRIGAQGSFTQGRANLLEPVDQADDLLHALHLFSSTVYNVQLSTRWDERVES